jgi:site-specific recombinase XerD
MSSRLHPDLYTPIRFWSQANQGLYYGFRDWLTKGGYSPATLSIYSCALRLAVSQLDKPYWFITDADLERVQEMINERFTSLSTRQDYHKGLLKLGEYLRQRQGKPQPPKPLNWPYYLAGLPDWLREWVRDYVAHCGRAWLTDTHWERSRDLLSPLTGFLRWATGQKTLNAATDLTPELWFGYLDERLKARMKPETVNGELSVQQSFVRFIADRGQPICDRFLRIEKLKQGPRLPKDVPVEALRRVYAAIEAEAQRANQANCQRMGLMDRAWFLLMLHSGLRVGEVRRLRQADLDLPGQRVRLEQSKGLKDRLAILSTAVVRAMEAYLPLRGTIESDHVFIYRHRPLTVTYCAERLRTYGEHCGITIAPHQLRHSCATLLLNAGAPILTVQTLLGHKHIDTTLGYARLYDGTVAADYYRAMALVEQRLQPPDTPLPAPEPGQLIALIDSLGNGTLNENQKEVVHLLRQGVLALAEQQNGHLPILSPDETRHL